MQSRWAEKSIGQTKPNIAHLKRPETRSFCGIEELGWSERWPEGAGERFDRAKKRKPANLQSLREDFQRKTGGGGGSVEKDYRGDL